MAKLFQPVRAVLRRKHGSRTLGALRGRLAPARCVGAWRGTLQRVAPWQTKTVIRAPSRRSPRQHTQPALGLGLEVKVS